MKRPTLALLASAALALAAGSASAATLPAAPPSARVAYGDLNATTDAGVEVLFARLRAAAKLVCGQGDIRDLKLFSAETACVAEALSHALDQVTGLKPATVATL